MTAFSPPGLPGARLLSFGALACGVLLCSAGGCSKPAAQSYLFVWAGDSARKSSDFLGVIDATPGSSRYGSIVASIPTGTSGTHPHHTEQEMPADGHLLANGFMSGTSFLFDLSDPTHPRLSTSFGDVGGFSHPHTYSRLANGDVLATFQYAAEPMPPMDDAHGGMSLGGKHSTGGLVEMDERGRLIRSGAARDTTIKDSRIYPYSVLALPAIDRAISTTTDMDEADSVATDEWVQIWRLSDLKLLKTFALPPGPRGDEHKFTGEPRLLPDGKSVYVHTFDCGLYLLRDLEQAAPTVAFVHGFPGKNCGVPLVDGHYWLQPVPEQHALVALDIADPEHPRQASAVSLADNELPHWIAIDPTGRRVVLNSGGYAKGDRLYLFAFDPSTGALSLDTNFRDSADGRPGVNLSGKAWPHGFVGTASPHGVVFSR
jgi:hypothetical protein